MDDDLQHRPDQIPCLLDALRAHPEWDAVFGVFARKRHRWYRNWGSRGIQALHRRAYGLSSDVELSSFRAMRRPLVAAVLRHGTRSPSLHALVCACTRRLGNVTVAHAERFAGRSNYTVLRQLRLAFDNLCGSSTLPLRLVSTTGFCLCAASFLYVGYVLWRYFANRIGVPGWTTLAILTSFFAGMILLSLGVFGQYMIRILREVRGSPRYVVREVYGSGSEGAGEA